MPNWLSYLTKPLTDAPTRLARKASQSIDPIEPMQQTGEGGLKDWLAWTDASAKGLLQGSGEAAGNVLSDMTSPLSIGMQALGAKGFQRLSSLARMGRNAARTGQVIGREAPVIESAISRLPAEFAANTVGAESAVNAPRVARMAKEAKDIADVSKAGNVGKRLPIKKDIAPEDWGDWGGAEKSMPTLGLDETGSTVAKKSGIGASRPEEMIANINASKKLPQVEDAYTNMRGTSVYKPEVSKEMSRLMVDMMDEGAMKDAFKIAQNKYPRLLGHTAEINIGAKPGLAGVDKFFNAGSSRSAGQGMPGLTSMNKLRINPSSYASQTAEGMANTIGHELAHGAQRLRRGEYGFNKAYNAGMSNTGGMRGEFEYLKNPLEKEARRSGKKFAKFATRKE